MMKSGSVKREKRDGTNVMAGRAIISLFSFKTSRRTSRRLRISSVVAEKEKRIGLEGDLSSLADKTDSSPIA
jgi:hypothetical protein